jgi:hypothetical protein
MWGMTLWSWIVEKATGKQLLLHGYGGNSRHVFIGAVKLCSFWKIRAGRCAGDGMGLGPWENGT